MKQNHLSAAIVGLLVLVVSDRTAQAAPAAAPPAATVKVIPAPGRPLPEKDHKDLEEGAAALGKEIDRLRQDLASKPKLLALLPDVQIYYNAVRYPLAYNEFFDSAKDGARGRALLAAGEERARQLHDGQAPWVIAGGARGYVSRIDGSVQPYWLAMPAGFSAATARRYRLDFFYHGRGETLTELSFLSNDAKLCVGTATDRFIVHPYGRYCNGNKLAGEIDTLEILDSLKAQYPIDEDRVAVSGFSMGGAACWNFTAHYTDLWAASSPGAGFSESAEFLHLAQSGELATTPWYQSTLWHICDCTDYAVNLAQLPTISYAGELDGQKQAGDAMEKAMAAEGLKLERISGPKTKHAYEKGAKAELDKRFDALVTAGRKHHDAIRFTTWTLRYNRMEWVTVDALEHHWQRARVDAKVDASGIRAHTQNVSALTFSFPAARLPFAGGSTPTIVLNDTKIPVPAIEPGRAWGFRFALVDGKWQPAAEIASGLQKRHGLQGPIDDAFLDRFIFVRPTGKPLNEKAGAWANAECDRAIARWRSTFRGEAIVKRDDELSDADIAASNIVLWGDPSSNRVLARLADKLPIRWDGQNVTLGSRQFPSAHHVPVLVYPNPLNPSRYVVLNSGFTFREIADANNARQVPNLPDYAVVDLDVPPGPVFPGGIVAAGFFGEQWQLLGDDGRGAVR